MSNPPRLNSNHLEALPNIAKPHYDRTQLSNGIVHIGVGGFHRAHQAVYTDDVLNSGDLGWGICGINLKSQAMRNKLEPQDRLYTVQTKHTDGAATLRIIGSINELHCAATAQGREATIDRIEDSACQVVSLTVTEKGYCHQGGQLDLSHPEIRHDLSNSNQPKSMPGLVAAALARRASVNGKPLTLISCDNLANNGTVLEQVILTMIEESHPSALSWVQENTDFPSTMVDRIVPQTTSDDFSKLTSLAGYSDEGLITCEPFAQWVIADRFAGQRPPWHHAGAEFVGDVQVYETCKLRMLNATHSALAYIGLLSGHRYIHQAMADNQLRLLATHLLQSEIVPTLSPPMDFDVVAYQTKILERFSNPSIPYTTQQVASDGSQKLSQRVLPTIADTITNQSAQNRGLYTVLAAWLHCLAGRDDKGQPLVITDPMAADVLTWLQRTTASPTASEIVAFVATQTPHFGELATNSTFTEKLTDTLDQLRTHGVGALVQQILG